MPSQKHFTLTNLFISTSSCPWDDPCSHHCRPIPTQAKSRALALLATPALLAQIRKSHTRRHTPRSLRKTAASRPSQQAVCFQNLIVTADVLSPESPFVRRGQWCNGRSRYPASTHRKQPLVHRPSRPGAVHASRERSSGTGPPRRCVHPNPVGTHAIVNPNTQCGRGRSAQLGFFVVKLRHGTQRRLGRLSQA